MVAREVGEVKGIVRSRLAAAAMGADVLARHPLGEDARRPPTPLERGSEIENGANERG